MSPLAAPKEIEISDILRKTPKTFIVNLIFWCFFLMMLDGLDFSAITFAAPLMAKEWHVSAKLFGVVFSAALLGIMAGSFIFGWLGDRIGRRKVFLIATLWFGVFTLLTPLMTSINSVLIMRFITGLGLGGAMPAAIVLTSEFAPKGQSVRWVTVMFTGYSLGAAAGGGLAAWVLPWGGWRALFYLGGALPLIVVVVGYFTLPESLRYLALKPNGRVAIAKLAAKLHPEMQIDANTTFVMHDEKKLKKGESAYSYKLLFVGTLALITPIIWLFYIANSLALWTLKSWFPYLFVAGGLTPTQAALYTGWYSAAGALGSLCVGYIMDKVSLKLVALVPLVGGVAVAILGHMTGMNLGIALFCAGFLVTGTQNILTAGTPSFYPTSIRNNASGAAIGIAKIGAIVGPVVSGILLGQKLPVAQLFYWIASPVALGAVFCFLLGMLREAHFAEMAKTTEAVAARR